MTRRLIALAVALTCLPASGSGQSFSVTAQVVQGCTVNGSTQTASVNFGTLAFGAHPAVRSGPIAASVTLGGASVQLECTANLALQLAVGAGLHSNGATRRLGYIGGDTYVVPYALYTTAAQTTPIPITGSVGVTIPASGLLDLPIHGVAILPGTGMMPGPYSDTLAVTLTW